MTITKSEIEDELKKKGDYVKIDYLGRLLKKEMATDVRKFVFLKLAEIYESKGLFSEGAKMIDSASLLSMVSSEKMKYHVKEAELYIKSGFFDRADEAVRKAMGEANPRDKTEIFKSITDFYKRQAIVYERENRRNHAAKVYEKLLGMKIEPAEKEEIGKKLLNLYEKLGKLKEYFALKSRYEPVKKN
ncbi:MAG: hypothetical protein AABW81_04595 [Nanoarchaeota archaeon]